MGATNAEAAVTHGHDDLQVRSRHFDTGGIGQCPAVQAMKGMGVKKGIEQARTSDIGHDGNIFPGISHVAQRTIQHMQYPVV